MKTNLSGILTLLLAFIVHISFAQEKMISGTVTDQSGIPLPGVNILIQNTTQGTQTDFDGNYTLQADVGQTVLFSYLGFKNTSIVVGTSSTINIQMEEDAQALDEVVVTALGIKRNPRSLGYSVKSVEADAITKNSEPDLIKSLNGKVPGVNVNVSTGVAGASNKISIRGTTSFQGGNQPLFVVDGTPYSNDQITTSSQVTGGGGYETGISSLDPNDIANIEVLKGAVAAALYGSRAVNGVIVVTTKSGKSGGLSNKKMEVSLNTGVYFEQIANLPDYQNTYGNGSNFNYSNANGSWGARFDSMETIPTWPNLLKAFPDQFGPTVPYIAQPNNVRDLFKTGFVADNSINISSANENSNFNLTFSNLDQQGYIPYNSYKRTNISTGGNFKLENGLQVGANISYSDSYQVGPFLGENQYSGAASSFARTLVLGRTWDLSLPYEDANGAPVAPNDGWDHPLWSWKHNQIRTSVNRTVANINFAYDFNEHINARYQLGINKYDLARIEITDKGSRAASGTGRVITDDYGSEEIESTFVVTFNYDLTEDLNMNFLVGNNVNQISSHRVGYTGTNLIADDIFTINNTANVVSDYDLTKRKRIVGVFGDLGLSYKKYLFLNTTARNDWSSTLPKSNNSFLYPSVSSSFIFTEAFGIENDILSYGKIRGGWANVSRDADPYQINKIFSVGTVYAEQPSVYVPYTLGNPDLKPENTEEFEVGFDLELFKKRAIVDFTWYKKTTTDLISEVNVPTSSGYSSLLTNIGEMENTGIEIGLKLIPIRTENFKWSTFTSFTKNKNMVNKLIEGLDRFPINVNEIAFVDEGQPFGVFYGSAFARDDEGNYLIEEGAGGILQALENQVIGDPNPDFKVGFTNTLKYKTVSLQAQFDWKEGGDISSTTIGSLLGRGVTKDTEDREGTFIIPGVYGNPTTGEAILDGSGNKIPNTTQLTMNNLYFSPTTNSNTFAINSVDEASIYDGTVFRLREISLTYDIPKAYLENTFIGSMTFSLVGNNLWFYAPNIPKYTNFDPDVNAYGSGNLQGIEVQSAPSSKRYGFKLNIKF
ncbi:SusC/RagA family TonB-linked outer membrane protein [Maribacter sp. ANRC-HE7]|uniref:SusC/RagA family TonB-linked outer membrane protein n=1 Tax=Maribacter aquimaris TaxID=2737171 RepID=A0ABR7V016_9FLAO|nr:SusC/RagA family TonB-linked outer membrane protein [Maribacter aquimaris]MBD0778184.1 SusC/RagA family TonB-linked outer membrane protein [Maribacter aquimaris]